jgi:hypothetical protein
MAEECPVPYFATHVSSVETLQHELARLGDYFKNPDLMEMSVHCLDVLEAKKPTWNLQKIPAFQEWIRPPSKKYDSVAYMIWRKPWMSVSRETYIGSVLETLGAKVMTFPEGEKYPVVELEELQESFLLFSSEPYPFAKKVPELKALDLEGAVVDGESYSWFGVRSVEFLRRQLGLA